MIVCDVPIGIKGLHHLMAGWLKFRLLKRATLAAQAKLNFVYFSYQPDFDYILLSLRSLVQAVPAQYIGKIFLVVDQKAPFDEAQIDSFKQLCPSLVVMPIYNFEWGSAQSTLEELNLFKDVCQQLDNDWDYVLKVDSDVLFHNGAKLVQILHSDTHAVGDGHYLNYEYAQGGLYMIRKHLIMQAFANTSLSDVEGVVEEIDSVGEDMGISHMLKQHGSPFFLTRLMLFPDEYNAITTLNTWVKNEFVAFHCHKDKQNMANLVKKFALPVSLANA